MPQFDSGVFLTQIFWLLLCFGFTMLVLWRRGIPQIKSIFRKRSARIEGQHQAAQTLEQQAKKITLDSDARLEKARQDANEMVSVALYQVNLMGQQRRSESLSIQKQRLAASEKNIRRRKQAAYEEIKSIGGETAKAIVKNLSGMNIEAERTDAVLAALLNESEAFSNKNSVTVSHA